MKNKTLNAILGLPFRHCSLVFATFLVSGSLFGGFQLVDDFESGTASAWTVVQNPEPATETDQFILVTDPMDSGNSVGAAVPLDVSSDAWIDRTIPVVSTGDMGTVFFRLYREDGPMVNGVGLTDMADDFVTGGWGSFEPYLIFWNNGDDRVLEARNGDSGNQNLSNEAFAGAWYKIWLVLDNDANTYDVYIQGGVWVEQTLLADDFGFRGVADPAGDLSRLLIKCGGDTGFSGELYLDDIYVDTKEANLSDPLAKFELVDNFESGDLSMWTVTMAEGGEGDGIAIADDPAGSDGSVGMLLPPTAGTQDAWIDRPIPAIPDGGLGTVFFRLYRADEEMVDGIGLTDMTEGYLDGGWGSFEPYLIFYNNEADRVMEARNGDSGNIAVSSQAGGGTWYKIWMVVNNATDSYDVYIKGGSWAKQTLIVDGFEFRGVADPAGDLTNLLVKAWMGSDAGNPFTAPLYLDDIYVDTQTANLADPLARFTLVDDFQNLDLTAWTVDGVDGQLALAADPAGGGANIVVSITPDGTAEGGDGWISRSIPAVSDGGVGTVFFRMYREDEDMVNGIGLTDLNEGFRAAGWGGYEPYIILYNNAEERVLEARNGDVGNIKVSADAVGGEWYKVWLVLDNETDTYNVYIEGGSWEHQTLVAGDFAFRGTTDPAGDLSTFLVKCWAGSDAENPFVGALYIDDLYVDAENKNLSDPSPTPKASVRVGFASSGAAPTLDGIRDSSYLATYAVEGWAPGQPVGASSDDLAGEFSGLYTLDGLYLFISVTDDVFIRDSGVDFYLDDSIQLFFDGDWNRGGNFDGENDVVFNLIPEADGSIVIGASGYPPPPAGADFSNLDAAMTITETGYDVEAFIPWEAINVMPVDSWLLGFDIAINEDDDGGDRDTFLALSAYTGGNNATDLFATAELWPIKTAVIPPTTDTITIDGIKDAAFSAAPVNHAEGRPGDGPAPDVTETTCNWQAIYDSEFLYFYAEVKDSAMPLDATPDVFWTDDSLELVLDPDNSDAGAYNGSGDNIAKITFIPLADGTVRIAGADNWPPPPAAADFTGIEAAYTTDASGWVLEAKIPFTVYQANAEAPVLIEPGKLMGIDIMINDDDDGGEGDYTLTWSAGTGVNFNTQRWGNGILAPTIQSTRILPAHSSAIVLDGEVDAAYANSWWNLVRRTDGDVVAPPPNDAAVVWAGLYDMDNLYLILEVIDDMLVVDSGDNTWEDDGLEIAFDVNNSGSTTFKLEVLPQLDGLVVARVAGFPTPTTGDQSGLDAAMVMTDVGYQVELVVPFALMQITPESMHTMGMEVVLNDDDDGEARDLSINWSSISGINFAGPTYGDAVIFPALFANAIGAEFVMDDQYQSDWLGGFTEKAEWTGWILHEDLGYLYAAYAYEGDWKWFWSLSLEGWVCTDQNVFPAIYILGQGWASLVVVDDKSGVYLYETGTWILLP